MKKVKDWWDGLLQLFFPDQCIGCGEDVAGAENYFCIACLYQWPRTKFENAEENPVEKIFRGRAPVAQAMAYCFFTKGSHVQQLLHLLKYRNEPRAAEWMGSMMRPALARSELYRSIQVIVPVPMFPAKERQRGYNQAGLLAKSIANNWEGTTYEGDVLKKTVKTDSQTRKTRLERWLNMKSKFILADPEKIQNRHVLLVDDVITTGGTLESCVQALHTGGPASVSVAAFAWSATIL